MEEPVEGACRPRDLPTLTFPHVSGRQAYSVCSQARRRTDLASTDATARARASTCSDVKRNTYSPFPRRGGVRYPET